MKIKTDPSGEGSADKLDELNIGGVVYDYFFPKVFVVFYKAQMDGIDLIRVLALNVVEEIQPRNAVRVVHDVAFLS